VLDDDLLLDFVQSFYGYGNYAANVWFVGMEEGGAGSPESVAQHLEHWQGRGRAELEDLREFQVSKGNADFFVDRPKLQRTWAGLARIMLANPANETPTEQVREFQANHLGRHSGNNALLELLPLPSPSMGKWLYGEHSRLPFLVDRETYRDHVVRARVEHVRHRVLEHRPRAVVFYSVNPWYMDWWRAISGVEFSESEVGGERVHEGSNGHTVFMITKHTVAHGLTSEFFRQVGLRLEI